MSISSAVEQADPKSKPFKVLVADNFHYQDRDHYSELEDFYTIEEALAACRKIVDDYLASAHKSGMAASELYASYIEFGEDPFIVGSDVLFSAWNYAKNRCEEICSE